MSKPAENAAQRIKGHFRMETNYGSTSIGGILIMLSSNSRKDFCMDLANLFNPTVVEACKDII